MDIKLLYGLINFAVLVVLLRAFLRKPMADFLADRSEGVQKELDEIGAIRSRTEFRFQEYRKKLEALEMEIIRLTKEMETEGRLEKETLLSHAKRYAEKIKSDASRVAEQELKKSRFQLQQLALQRSLTIAQKIIVERVTVEDHERLMDEFIVHLGRPESRVS